EPFDLATSDGLEPPTRPSLLPEQQEVVKAQRAFGQGARPRRVARAVGETGERGRDGCLALRAGDARRPFTCQSKTHTDAMAARPDPPADEVDPPVDDRAEQHRR